MALDHRDWAKLRKLITEHVDACIEDSWSGSGRPEDIEAKKALKNIAKVKLNHHIEYMKERERTNRQ